MIPTSFKISGVTYKVTIGDVKEHDNIINFGLADASNQLIHLGRKRENGTELSEERINATYYHELAHVLLGEMGAEEQNADEVFVELLGRSLRDYIETVKFNENENEE